MLKVWLPLDGDLRNLGTSEVIITNHGATINNSGKIGKCYQFDNSSSYIELNCSELYKILNGGTQPFSVCFWVNQIDSSRAIILGDYSVSGGNNFNIELNVNHNLRWYWGTPDIVISAMNVGINTWTHVTFTYSGTVLKGYINGIEKYTNTITLNEKNRTSGSYYLGRDGRTGTTTLNGYLNDFRIYDHALSAAEVREIAQGLVLHYKLDGPMGGANFNLGNYSRLLNGASASVTNSNWSKRGASTLVSSDNINKVNCTAAWQGFSLYANNLNLQVGTNYTISCYGYTNSESNTNAGISFYPMMYNSSGTRDTTSKMPISVMGGSFTDANAKSIGLLNTSVVLYYATFTWNQTMKDIIDSGGKIELTLQIHGTFPSGRIDTLYLPQLEIGNSPTNRMSSCFDLGIDTTIIKDSSGYGHNGEINDELYLLNNSARYENSALFDGIDDCIKIPFNEIIKDKNYTISVWTYKTTIGTKNYQTILGGPSGFELEARSSSSTSPLYRIHNWGGGTTPYEFNKWNLFTFVHSDSDSKLYVNGELKITGTSVDIPTGNYYIGAWKTATQQNYEGQMSDFRIYCTSLLDTDIKLLYNVSSRIDNLGGIHSFELSENDNNLLAGTIITSNYGNRINPYTKYNSNGELYFDTNGTSAGSYYIPINPTGHTYYYDFDISVNTGNQFYIGFERFDADKTSRSNNATVYIYAKNSSVDINHQHIFGTVDLSTDGVNPCAFIALRILNGWGGTTSGVTGTAIIHSMSLREISTMPNQQIQKNGTLTASEFKEYQKASFYKNGFIEASEFIEM